MNKCALVIRVSTEEQALSKEGSLKNQHERLRYYINSKNQPNIEEWIAVEPPYELRGISGKDAYRSKEFARLRRDIELGNVNTILCTALDRISRSLDDFRDFFAFLKAHKANFVCLNLNFDTSTAIGEFSLTIMMAFAQLERKQTSERMLISIKQRASRGLWNGGYVMGYDLEQGKDKGRYLIPNEKEKTIVNMAFNTYLECGSFLKTAHLLNNAGYRTKEFSSRRGKHHVAKLFGYSSVKGLLTNKAYIGLREINKKCTRGQNDSNLNLRSYETVPAVWEPIVDERIFNQVQALIKLNTKSNHNQAKTIRHPYILNGGLLYCERCGSEMEGRSGTGHHGTRYYYYVDKNPECHFKVPANEIEGLIIQRIRRLALQSDIISGIVKTTNAKIQNEAPKLIEQKRLLQRELSETNQSIDQIITNLPQLETQDNNQVIKERLDEYARRSKDIKEEVKKLEKQMNDINYNSVNQEKILTILSHFSRVFNNIKPYEQKILLKLILHKAVLGNNKLKIALSGYTPDAELFQKFDSTVRFQPSTWLLGEDSNLQPAG